MQRLTATAAGGNLTLRAYQERGVVGVFEGWREHRRQCLVCPTGGGKTAMGEACVALFPYKPAPRVLWLAHRRELIKNAAQRLAWRFGAFEVGMLMPGAPAEPYARVQVASLDTLIARGVAPEADLVVFDEAHHAAAESYAAVLAAYPNAYHLGLTATPERADGSPLGDAYDGLVVAAQYSELIRDGFLVPMRVFHPSEVPEGGLARDPVEAWEQYGGGEQTFAFFATVAEAELYAQKFNERGIPALAVSARTSIGDRDRAVEAFRRGEVSVLCNVNVFTEGTDVPEAKCILLGRVCRHESLYLQICGRALRPCIGSSFARLVDLTGAFLVHGSPTEDRIYSLHGDAIGGTGVQSLRECMKCGATVTSDHEECPVCGRAFPRRARASAGREVHDWQLQEVFDGAQTPEHAQVREYARLRRVAARYGFGLGWVGREYEKLFATMPREFAECTEEEKMGELELLTRIGRERGFKPGFAKKVFRQTFGHWPSDAMVQSALAKAAA